MVEELTGLGARNVAALPATDLFGAALSPRRTLSPDLVLTM